MSTIIKADAKDAEEIIALQRLAYQSEAKLYNNWCLPALTQTVDSLIQEFDSSVILKAVIAGKIIGSVRCKLDERVGRIGRLIVHPEFQGRGIGSRLLEYIEQIHLGSACFELFTGDKSERNIQLYKRHGYEISHTKALSDGLVLVYLVKPAKNL